MIKNTCQVVLSKTSTCRWGEVEGDLDCVIFKGKQKEKALNTGLKHKREIIIFIIH